MAVVYIHTRNDTNEVFYVGIGKTEKRAYSIHNRNPHWHNVVNKTSYTVTVTHENIIIEEALSIEQYLISFYGRQDKKIGSLVNKTDGGDGVKNPSNKLFGKNHPMYGKKHSEETRRKMREWHSKNKKPISEATKNKKRLNSSGVKNPMYGKRGELSPAYGLKRTEETKRKLSELRKGKKNPKMAGERNPNYGKTGGKNVAAKKVVDLSSGVIYECALYAANAIGMPSTTLRNMLNGYRKNKTNLAYL